jgi:hypothetical protein
MNSNTFNRKLTLCFLISSLLIVACKRKSEIAQVEVDVVGLKTIGNEQMALYSYMGKLTSDGHMLLAVKEDGALNDQRLLVKVDTFGNVVWQKAFAQLDVNAYYHFSGNNSITSNGSPGDINEFVPNLYTVVDEKAVYFFDAQGTLLDTIALTEKPGYTVKETRIMYTQGHYNLIISYGNQFGGNSINSPVKCIQYDMSWNKITENEKVIEPYSIVSNCNEDYIIVYSGTPLDVNVGNFYIFNYNLDLLDSISFPYFYPNGSNFRSFTSIKDKSLLIHKIRTSGISKSSESWDWYLLHAALPIQFFTNMSVGYHSKYRNVMSLTKLSNGNFLAINAWPDSEYIELTELISPGYTDTIKNSFKVPLFSPAGYSKDFNFNCNMTIPSPNDNYFYLPGTYIDVAQNSSKIGIYKLDRIGQILHW